MNWLRILFRSNFENTLEELLVVRAAVKRWGFGVVAVVLAVMVFMASRDVDPTFQAKSYDLTLKALYGLARGVLAVVGYVVGAALGYFVFQVVESSKAGADATRPDPTNDVRIQAAESINRGRLLALCVVGGAVVVGLALSGAR